MTPDSRIRGKVYVLGDNIDTDQIIPAQYLNLVPTIPDEYEKLGSYALCGVLDAPRFVPDGAIKAAGLKFSDGIGEHFATKPFVPKVSAAE